MKIEELQEKEAKLEREIIDYMEADDNRNASRKRTELRKIQQMIELEELGEKKKIKHQLDIAIKFIKEKGMNQEFESFKMSQNK